MIAIIIDYPEEAIFRSRKPFASMEDRTAWLHKSLRRRKICGENHRYEDYVVEAIDIIEDTENEGIESIEIWVVGS